MSFFHFALPCLSWRSFNKNLGLSAEELQSKLLDEISGFVGDAPQSDDITLMVLARDLAS